jgi:RHS repeat-associated protein
LNATLTYDTGSGDNLVGRLRLASMSDPSGTTSYSYDEDGNLISETRTLSGTTFTTEYGYDAAGNLRQIVYPSGQVIDYVPDTTDPARVAAVRLNTTTTLASTIAYLPFGPKLFQYDDDGNTITRILGAGNVQPPITDPAHYAYASTGQRSTKDNSASVIYHYDRSGQLIAETTPTGTLIRAYVWLEGQPLAMIGANNAVYYFHNDHLGTPQRLTDSTGATVWAADYLPFGKANVTVATVENNLRFSGQYYDNETGLHYNYWRYYDPGLGRYLRADPIGIKGGINLYSFANSNPINLFDPLGLYSWGDVPKAWDHYCDGTQTPWTTSFEAIHDLKSKAKLQAWSAVVHAKQRQSR